MKTRLPPEILKSFQENPIIDPTAPVGMESIMNEITKKAAPIKEPQRLVTEEKNNNPGQIDIKLVEYIIKKTVEETLEQVSKKTQIDETIQIKIENFENAQIVNSINTKLIESIAEQLQISPNRIKNYKENGNIEDINNYSIEFEINPRNIIQVSSKKKKDKFVNPQLEKSVKYLKGIENGFLDDYDLDPRYNFKKGQLVLEPTPTPDQTPTPTP